MNHKIIEKISILFFLFAFAMCALADENGKNEKFTVNHILKSQLNTIYQSSREDILYAIGYKDGYYISEIDLKSGNETIIRELKKCKKCSTIEVSLIVSNNDVYVRNNAGIFDINFNQLWQSRGRDFRAKSINGFVYIGYEESGFTNLIKLGGEGDLHKIKQTGQLIDFDFSVGDGYYIYYSLFYDQTKDINNEYWIDKTSGELLEWRDSLASIVLSMYSLTPRFFWYGKFDGLNGVFLSPNGEYEIIFINSMGKISYKQKTSNKTSFAKHFNGFIYFPECNNNNALSVRGRANSDRSVVVFSNKKGVEIFSKDFKKTWSILPSKNKGGFYISGNEGLFEIIPSEEICS